MFLPSVPGLTLSGFCTQDRMILYMLHFLLYILLEYACVFSFILLGGWGWSWWDGALVIFPVPLRSLGLIYSAKIVEIL